MKDRKNQERFLSISLANVKISQTPEFKEVNGKPWVYFGDQNNWPEQMLDLFKSSSDHRAIIQGKSRFIAGKGIEFPEGSQSHPILIQANQDEAFHDVLAKAAKDWEIFRGFYIRVRFNRLGDIARIWQVPFHTVRSNKAGTKFYICDKWGDQKAEKQIETLDSLQTSDRLQDAIWSWFDYDPAGDCYPVPEYVAAIPYLSIDKDTANFHQTNVGSGFTAGTMITMFQGEPDADAKRELDRKIKAKTTGSDKGGEVLVYWADEDETPPKVDALRSNDLDKQFLPLGEVVQQKVFTAHSITSGMLFGIKTAGQLGGRKEMMEAWELLDANYIEPQQDTIIKAFTTMLQKVGKVAGFTITKLQPVMRDILELLDKGLVQPEFVQEAFGLPTDKAAKTTQAENLQKSIAGLSPLLANKVLESLTEDEIRSIAGLGPKAPAPNPEPLAATTQMSAEIQLWNDDIDLEVFAQFGELASDFEILDKAALQFAATLDQDAQKVLLAISQGDLNSLQEIATATGLEIGDVSDYIEELITKKMISPAPSAGGGMTITPTGQLEIDQKDPGTVLIQTKWKYNGPEDSKNRPFCAKLMELGRVYTKEDIAAISARLGYDVWKRRGGWYRVPGSDPALNIPHCRHNWEQVIVRRRAQS
jgi:DNA-binding MarR family transcriptional regulator